MSTGMHRFNHCLPSIAKKADRSEAQRLAEDSLDLDGRVRRTSPLWDGGNVATEGGVVRLVDYDTEEGIRLLVRAGLELGMDHYDECGGHSGKQTSLPSNLAHAFPCDVRDSRISRRCSDRRHISS